MLAIPLLLLAAAVTPQGDPEPPAPESAITRCVVIGASMSAGFGIQGASLGSALERMLRTPREPVLTDASAWFFMDPAGTAERQIAAARTARATLVVAADYLFWFGYGAVGSEERRLELLEKGLSTLEGFECPLVVGDFPNMGAAVGRGMLMASQMPAVETLARLNERLRAWAREHPNVVVLPLAEAVEKLHGDAAFKLGRQAFPAQSSKRMLQADALHPSRAGLCAVAHLLGCALVDRGIVGEDEIDLDYQRVLSLLGSASGATAAPAGQR